MALVSLIDLFADARRGNYALGYFEAWDATSLEAVLDAAEAEHAPVILGFGCMMLDMAWLDHGGIELLGAMGRAVAQRSNVPVALLLNEARTFDQVVRGMDAGFNAVMLDTSSWNVDEATVAVAKLAKLAHARGIAVEAELGHLPDAVGDGIDDSEAALTNPAQAARFVEQTDVDCLAVSIGNVHLLTKGYAPVDMTHMQAIHAQVPVPLVIHGGTSFPPDQVPQAIAAGALKFNVGTILKKVFLEGMRETVDALPAQPFVHDLIGSHKEADLLRRGQLRMTDKVRELIRLYRNE